jgi:hypothetical protein
MATLGVFKWFKKFRLKRERNKYFKPKNRRGESKVEHQGPYTLVINTYKTKPGCWEFSSGTVYKDSKEIFQVKRNYRRFPYLLTLNHPNGHDYLICGEDYQGQTVLELDTKRRKDYLPKAAAKGSGFCWSSYTFDSKTKLLVVDGCYWAASYEYKFFDFSDPMAGWPELDIDGDGYIDADGVAPTFESDGTIKTYETRYADEQDDEADEDKRDIVATKTFRREGNKLVLVSKWIDDKEKVLRAENEEAQRKFDEWLKNYKKTDPLYLAMVEGLKDSELKPSNYDSVGGTYAGWCPDPKVQETRVCRRIHEDKKATVDLEIAAKTGPVKLICYNKTVKNYTGEDKFFMTHSPESVTQAMDFAKQFVRNINDECYSL